MIGMIVDTRKKRRSGLLLGWSFVCACVLLLICSKSSPLYPANDWVDVQCFFTVGRGIVQGKMPYLDLYEQKGPVLYLLFALAALISSNSFFGVFLLEVVCFTLFLYESVKIIALYVEEGAPVLFLAPPLLAFSVAVCPAFSHGSSAEEFFLPVMALFLRVVLTAIGADRPLFRGEAFLCGVLAGLGLWVKYTFCGIFAGGALALIVWYAVTGKAKRLWSAALWSLLGLAAVTAPLLLWFSLKGALSSLWQVYFVNNLTSYANGSSPRHDPPLAALWNNRIWFLPAILGCLWLLARPKRRWGQALFVLCAALTLGLFTYANGRTYSYYALILSVFGCLGWAPILLLLQKASRGLTAARRGWIGATASLMLLMGCGIGAYRCSGNVYLMAYSREDMPAYRFAAIIRQEEDPSLLNTGFLDGGFYLAAGVEPENRFFCTFNIGLKEQTAEHSALVKSGAVRFVVTRGKKAPGKNYELVDQCSFPFEGRNWTYCLYRLK